MEAIIKRKRKLKKKMNDYISFKHSANAGDLIYSLPAIREIYRKTGKKAIIYQWLDQETKYWGEHPLGNKMFNKKMYEVCKPLIEDQEYVEKFEIWEGQQIHYDIDRVRDHKTALNLPYGDIRQWVMMYYPEMQASIGETWLRPKENPDIQNDLIVVNRTSRYRNQFINYEFINDYEGNIAFIGVLDEYADFVKEVPRAVYIKTDNYLQVRNLICQAKLFIGNQSSCFAIAEGLGLPRILEVCRTAPNVIPATRNGYLFLDQNCFEELFKMLS